MTNVGWIGLGKLGAPCAAALQYHGDHTVFGYDIRGRNFMDYDWSGLPPIALVESIDDVVRATDGVVYLAIQTPHSPRYGGERTTPIEPREFEYSYLINAVRVVVDAANRYRQNITLVIVSTVLPGTFDRHMRSIVNGSEHVTTVYHPFFIAMGTVVEDFIMPEMTLFGVDRLGDESIVRYLYTFHNAPAPTMSIASAELTKVAYNTFISMKIVYANLMAEMCEATGADVDEVTGALAQGTDRIISARYLTAGMGDGGACHPRDNIALSALAQRYRLSSDLMGFLSDARDQQARWFASIIEHWRELTQLKIVLLGRSYKPNVELTDGSPALLLADTLDRCGAEFTHIDLVFIDGQFDEPAIFFIATKHEVYRDVKFTDGSVIIDPFGYIKINNPAVTLVTPGRK